MRYPLLAALLVTLAAPATALGSGADVIRDCQDGKIDAKYSASEFSNALRNIPTDVDEYTDCRDVIRRAQLGSAAGSGGGNGAGAGIAAAPGGGGGAAGGGAAGGTAAQLLAGASPAEQKAVRSAIANGGGTPVKVGDEQVSPDTTGLSPAGAANVVPTPLIIALALLGVGLAFGGTHTLRSRVLARRTPAT